MNDKYLETDKNKYLVLDENKNISLVNLDIDAKEILNLENDLEDKENNYNKLKQELKELKGKLYDKKVIDKVFFSGFLLLCIGLSKFVPVTFFVIAYALTKSITLLYLGTNKEQEKIIKEKIGKINIEKEEINELYNKLEYTKEKYNYKKTNINDFIDNNYCLEYDNIKDKPMSYISKDAAISYEGNKVKKLVKRPDIK